MTRSLVLEPHRPRARDAGQIMISVQKTQYNVMEEAASRLQQKCGWEVLS